MITQEFNPDRVKDEIHEGKGWLFQIVVHYLFFYFIYQRSTHVYENACCNNILLSTWIDRARKKELRCYDSISSLGK